MTDKKNIEVHTRMLVVGTTCQKQFSFICGICQMLLSRAAYAFNQVTEVD